MPAMPRPQANGTRTITAAARHFLEHRNNLNQIRKQTFLDISRQSAHEFEPLFSEFYFKLNHPT
jgi:hypothetical protein